MTLPSMWDRIGGDDKIDGSMNRAAQLRKDLTKWERTGDRIMERIIEGREEANAAGLDVSVRMGRPAEAYMDAWLAGDERERIAMVNVTDPPLPDVHEDNQ